MVPWAPGLFFVADRPHGFGFADGARPLDAPRPPAPPVVWEAGGWGCGACVFDSEPEHTCGGVVEVLAAGYGPAF